MVSTGKRQLSVCQNSADCLYRFNYRSFLNKKKDVKLGSKMPFERGEILSQRAFSIYTDIRKLQDKAKTSYTLSTRRLRFGYE